MSDNTTMTVTEPQGARGLAFTISQMRPQIAESLPPGVDPERFIRVAMNAVQNMPELSDPKIERQSVFNACLRAAQLGLMPDKREGAIVIVGEKRKGPNGQDIWVKVAQFRDMIGGLRKLAAEFGFDGASGRLGQRLTELQEEMFGIVGHPFNQRSTQQMSQVLFQEMNFPTKGLTKTSSGQISTAVSELEKLSAMSHLLSDAQKRMLTIIFEQRQLEKLRGTYVDSLPAQVNPQTGRLHTSFNQAGASTGRMSSSDPNLQNIPIRTELGREIRRAFVAPPGCILLSADYSQVELRILAHVAQEKTLLDAFRADQDIHAVTAALLFSVPLEQVTRDQRGLAKTINFATIYGSSAFGISSRTEMDQKQAQQFLNQYFVTYPRIRDYIGNTLAMVNAEGYVQTLLGRKRYFPELKDARLPYSQRQAVERAAINAPIQGTAADIMKIAMIRLYEKLQAGGFQARMLLQVHDELVLELPKEELAEIAPLVCEVMESAYTLDVPLRVDVEAGPNWYDQEKAD